MELIRRNIRYYDIAFDSEIVHEEMVDVIVPDLKADILRILSGSGSICVKEQFIQNDKAVVSGTVNTEVLYVPDNGSAMEIVDVPINFSHAFECSGISQDAEICVDAKIRNIDVRMINPRKISVRAFVLMRVKIYQEKEYSVTSGTISSADESIETLKKSVVFSAPVNVKRRGFALIDDMEIPDGKPDAQKILKYQVLFEPEEIRALNNKAIVRGTASVPVSYISGQSGRIEHCTFFMPFSHVIDIDGVDERSEISVYFWVKNAEFGIHDDAYGARRMISASIGVDSVFEARQEISVDALCDIYSTSYEMSTEAEIKSTITSPERAVFQCDVSDTIEPGVFAETIIDCDVMAGCADVRTDEKNLISSDVYATAVFLDSNGELGTVSKRIQTAASIDDSMISRIEKTSANVKAYNLSTNAKGEISITATIEMLAELNASEKFSNIKSAVCSKEAKGSGKSRYSLVMSYITQEEKLWDLAKRYNTTVSSIAKANEIESKDIVKSGEMLLIPISKCQASSIKEQ